MNLIIVESPTKARTLGRFLGGDYSVEATIGHIKDLPKSKLGVDFENNFTPDYVDVPRQEKTIKNLKRAAKKAERIFLATDPDREGEAISAHVQEILLADGFSESNIKRIVFHEITQSAVEHAISEPREVDGCLVDAQVARRVLDRLVGYTLSPVLWKKVRRGLSAGRVQTVAVRLIVEREREIEAFRPVEYWEIASEVRKGEPFLVSLAKVAGKKAEVKDEKQAEEIVSGLESEKHVVSRVVKKQVKKRPYAPFTTSTMTQAAAIAFGWSAKRTMSVAQKLYEEGFITYHRTDSTFLSRQALGMARGHIKKELGKDYLPEKPRMYKTKSKSAQEAHEAVRPTNVGSSGPEEASQRKLYRLIWSRFMASQMADAIYDRTSIEVSAGKYLLKTAGQIVKFDGWRKVLPGKAGEVPVIPDVSEGDVLELVKVHSEQKFTSPPPRYNEASIIKTLEKLGIGRPSTYAPTISTIQTRGYVEKKDGRFFATAVGMTTTDFLVEHFPKVFDYEFTAKMENDLDNVAEGKLEWRDNIKDFWGPFSKKSEDVTRKAERVKIPVEKLDKKCPKCGTGELVIRTGRFGKFISCSTFPECDYTEKYDEKVDIICPKCGKGDVVVKKTKKGRTFYGCSRYPDCDYAAWRKPKKGGSQKNRR